MLRKKYTAEFKTKIVLLILQGDKEFSENGLNPNMVRKWKQDFLQNAHLAFGADSERKAVQRKDDDLKKLVALRYDASSYLSKVASATVLPSLTRTSTFLNVVMICSVVYCLCFIFLAPLG